MACSQTITAIFNELGLVPRPEHPRPDKLRPDWMNLNGVWDFTFDPDNLGLTEGWPQGTQLAQRIVVPFCPESKLSGLHDEQLHPICWYARSFDLSDNLLTRRLLLHFGAVDYRCDVWLNGHHLGSHEGGYDSFDFDITTCVKPTGNRLALRIHDDPHEQKPHGKQAVKPEGCVYMRTTGIWQTVWLEAVGSSFLRDWVIKASADGSLDFTGEIEGQADDLNLTAILSLQNHQIAHCEAKVQVGSVSFALQVPDVSPWSPASPVLYDLELTLVDAQGMELDQVRTYVGFRTIEVKDGHYWLNGSPFFLVSALDQGYYPDGLYTAKTDALLREDVVWAKRYGLNSIRKHQIVAEPRFYYWCDQLGLTVWGEMGDWGADITSNDFASQWLACMKRDLNHPCIITWVPMNEQLDPDKAEVSEAKVRIYRRTKALDPTRPVVDNSGFCHTETDLVDLHVNPKDGEDCRRWWREWRKQIAETGNFMTASGPIFADGFRYCDQPVIISETGNWWIKELPPAKPWSPYGCGPVQTVADFITLYQDFFFALMTEPDCAGFSYVQLYDVEGEVNGYLTYDRKSKVAPELIAAIHAEGAKRRFEQT